MDMDIYWAHLQANGLGKLSVGYLYIKKIKNKRNLVTKLANLVAKLANLVTKLSQLGDQVKPTWFPS